MTPNPGSPRASVSLEELDADPHPALARLRERSPVCWVPELGGWLVTGYEPAVAVLRDAASFTVDDPRFTTARVTGPSMLSLDGPEHARHRGPFARALPPVVDRLAEFTAGEAARLANAIAPDGTAELRTSFAGPLAAAVMTEALGLRAAGVTPATLLSWYRDIVATVAALPAGEPDAPAARVPVASFAALAAAVREAADHAPLLAAAAAAGGLAGDELVSNAAVAAFGGIETTEGMICNAVLALGKSPRSPVPALVEESLRLEPAAARVDRYAARDVTLGGARIRRGDPVIVSLTGANRDPAVFPEPDRFDPRRPDAERHLAFARGPHFCLGARLARLETVTAVTTLASRLPGLRADPGRPAKVRGQVFRKPLDLHATWDRP